MVVCIDLFEHFAGDPKETKDLMLGNAKLRLPSNCGVPQSMRDDIISKDRRRGAQIGRPC
jgi:hypothetical protein